MPTKGQSGLVDNKLSGSVLLRGLTTANWKRHVQKRNWLILKI